MTFCLVVVGLTEDKRTATLLALLKRVLSRVIDPETQTQRVDFQPYDEAHRPIVGKNMWESTSGRHQRQITEFNRYLARVASQAPLHVVVHHFDADEPWAAEPCARLRRWEHVVARAIAGHWGEHVAARIVPLVPHPELEAWLYLNEARLSAIAARDGRACPVPPAVGWHACTGVKDEHPWPNDTHNLELARTFPAVRAAEKCPSLAAAVTRLRGVPGLLDALAATRAAPSA